ncbi:hypothetical protein ElyMa_005859200 [Elysia marginata]|uniref:Uncharacterized protein n=1 Tax=Elysia marginata TaxID=1093978 RepID=A0AAV4G020_9GAST|nr:hypothetical protein ElyMa_005859200 [Elysia marginata]
MKEEEGRRRKKKEEEGGRRRKKEEEEGRSRKKKEKEGRRKKEKEEEGRRRKKKRRKENKPVFCPVSELAAKGVELPVIGGARFTHSYIRLRENDELLANSRTRDMNNRTTSCWLTVGLDIRTTERRAVGEQ